MLYYLKYFKSINQIPRNCQPHFPHCVSLNSFKRRKLWHNLASLSRRVPDSVADRVPWEASQVASLRPRLNSLIKMDFIVLRSRPAPLIDTRGGGLFRGIVIAPTGHSMVKSCPSIILRAWVPEGGGSAPSLRRERKERGRSRMGMQKRRDDARQAWNKEEKGRRQARRSARRRRESERFEGDFVSLV